MRDVRQKTLPREPAIRAALIPIKTFRTPGLDKPSSDRPLTFYWEPRSTEWVDALSLPPVKREKTRRAMASIVTQAFVEDITGGRRISYSRNRNFYAGKSRYNGTDFTYATVTESVDRLSDAELLDNRIAPNKGPCGLQSTFRATDKLIAAAARPLVSAHLHELVVLRDSVGRTVDYQDTRETRKLRRNVAEINEAISSAAIGLDTPDLAQDGQFGRLGDALVPFPRIALYRVFNENFQNGGRHYGLSNLSSGNSDFC